MREAIRVGLIGSGGISRAHARGYHSVGDQEARVVVTCDTLAELASERAAELGAEAAVTDWRAVLARSDVDAVDICLPHDLHAEAAVAAADAGKHILVEKPLATTLRDADAMIQSAKEAGVVLMCALCQRYDPNYVRIKEIVDEGWLGVPVLSRIDQNQNVETPPGHWIRSRERLGGGAVASAGCHRIDLLRWYFGEIVGVTSFTYTWADRMEGEVAGTVNFLFRSGAIGNLTINWMSRSPAWFEGVWLEGTEGAVHNHGGVHVKSLRRPEWRDQAVPLDIAARDPFEVQLRHFLECVREGKEALTSGEEARRTLAVALAAYESERTGRAANPLELS